MNEREVFMPLNCLGTIRSFYSKLSEKEKKIADYILEKPEIIIHRTINEVADDLNIADATVFRFAKRIGFKGFQAMKIALASEITTSSRIHQQEPALVDHEKTLTEKIFKSNIRTLQKTLQMIDSHSIRMAVDLIVQAESVSFFGTGNSASIAMNAFYKFADSGVKSFAVMDSYYQAMAGTHLTEKDVAVFFSYSGLNKETLHILKKVNETGAKTIGITGNPKSPLSQKVDLALYTHSEETESLSLWFTSQIAQLSLIDALCLTIFHVKKETTPPEN
jgi:RpiR family transcriptional regulator, carbohydrate utilization regulator